MGKSVICLSAIVLLAMAVGPSIAETDCTLLGEDSFAGDGERVRFARGKNARVNANFAVFKAPLAVNTDGAPTSYHPQDFLGERLAINRIDNGIAIRRKDGHTIGTAEKIAVFARWRASKIWSVPSGYTISWKNVIAAGPDGLPCIFSQGAYTGYFGSLTALQNGLSSAAAGQCAYRNQQDLRYIPALALRGGDADPLQRFGARTGDLVLAHSPITGAVVAAVIGDTGDGDRIGEGSVALNKALKGTAQLPTTYAQARGLDTGREEMVVAVLPGTRAYRRQRPYSANNLADRVQAWAREYGYGSTAALATAATACANGL